jgi:hypothetical protein
MNEAHRESPEMKRVGDWRPDTALLGIEAQPKCLCPINNQLDCMLHDRARANKGTIIKVPSLMHFWALLMDVANKGMDCECEKQWGERVPLLYAGGGLNNVLANILSGSAAIGHFNVMQNAWAMEDNFLQHAVTVDSIESIFEVQADDDKVGGMLLICH